MVIKHFRLSLPEKERLIRMKSRTGIQNWNILCRWAFCWSLAEPSSPGGIDPKSDSNVEMDWTTLLVSMRIFMRPCFGRGVLMMRWEMQMKPLSNIFVSS